jgi:hypothetical protein
MNDFDEMNYEGVESLPKEIIEKPLKRNSVVLYYDDTEGNEKEFEVFFRRPSLEATDSLLKIRSEFMNELAKLDKKYADLHEHLAGLPEIDGKKEITNPEFILKNEKFLGEIKMINITLPVRMFKVIYSTKGLSSELVKLLEKPLSDKFWRTQDYNVIEEAVNSFRISIGI